MSNLKPAIFAAGSLFMLAVLYLLLRQADEYFWRCLRTCICQSTRVRVLDREEVEEENGSTSDSKESAPRPCHMRSDPIIHSH